MKKLLIFSAILLFTNIGLIHPQAYNGWAFLPWNIKKDSVESLIKANKSKLSAPNALDADFKYQEMNTWLYFDSLNLLNKVHQRITFSVIQKDEAAAFYKMYKSYLIKTYGKPDHVDNNKKKKNKFMYWKLFQTRIVLNYDYKYKIIDEFGGGSYWVDVVFEAKR